MLGFVFSRAYCKSQAGMDDVQKLVKQVFCCGVAGRYPIQMHLLSKEVQRVRARASDIVGRAM